MIASGDTSEDEPAAADGGETADVVDPSTTDNGETADPVDASTTDSDETADLVDTSAEPVVEDEESTDAAAKVSTDASEPDVEEDLPEDPDPESTVEAGTERNFDPAVTADVEIGGANRTRRKLVGGALFVMAALAAAWGIAEAVEIKGQQVDGTVLSPESYLAQVVSVEVDGVENQHTLGELGWLTQPTDRVTGRLFARLRLHDPVKPPGGSTASPIIDAYRSELHRDPVAPEIDAAWRVVDGKPGVASEVTAVGSSPLARIVVSPVEVEPDSSAPLRWFVHQRDRDSEGWEIKLLKDDGTLGASLSSEEVAGHIQFDRESASLGIADEAGLRELLDERTRPFARGGERGRFEFEAAEDEVTPLIQGSRFEVIDELNEPLPGEVADLDKAWTDLIETMQSFGRVVSVPMIEPDELYGGVDPATLTVKLAESRTPNTGGSRMTNIRNVLDATRGVVVEPGGVFGLNQTVGRRTSAKGYVLAGAIANGEHVDAFGGGVSQTATMFYQAAYMAGLTFPEREGGGIGGGHQAFGHSEGFGRYNNYYAEGWGLDSQLDTGRLGYGVEQTVNWPNREAGFINTTPYPILVWTFDTGRQVGVSLWSLERDRFGVYEGTGSWRRGSCIDWTHSRTVYDMDDEVMFEDSYNGYYRTQGPTCAFVQPDPEPDRDE